MAQIIPYLNFNGTTREVMSFYQQCIGGELVLQKVAESPMAAKVSSELGNHILHSSLTKNDFAIMASDMRGNKISMGNNVILCINCTNGEELNSFFNNLSSGGTIQEPLHQTFWGATYGKLTDKYGIHWMFNYSKK